MKTRNCIISTPRLISRLTSAPMIIFFVTALFTAWLVFACRHIELTYLRNYGYFFDPASYYQHNIDLYRLYQQSGLGSALSYEIQHNSRFPFRTIPYLLFAPQQLVTNFGHMWSEMPFVWLFLYMYAGTLYQRTKSLCFALAASSIFLGVPYLYDPTLGIAGFWLDFTSACALGCAALSLVAYHRSRNIGWMLAFGALASVAALSRFSSSFYVLAYASLAMPCALLSIDRCDYKNPQPVPQPVLDEIRRQPKINWQDATFGLLAALLTALPGLAFLFAFLQENRSYYSTYGYAFGAPIMQSIAWTVPALVRLLGLPILATLLFFSGINLILLLCKRMSNRPVLFLSLWLPISIFLFVCFVVKAVDGWHCLVYFIPALMVSAFVPLARLRPNHIWWRALVPALAILSIATTICSYKTFHHLAKNPPPHLALRKQADAAMARFILQTQAPSFLQFDTESLMPQLEVFLNQGFFTRWPSTMFSIHETYMKNYYPGKEPTAMSQAVYNQLKREVALVAVFDHPGDAEQPGVFNNPYSSTVARRISEMVASDTAIWHRVGSTDSPNGKLSIYSNSTFKNHLP